MKKAFKFILSFISMIIILMVSLPIIISMLLQVSIIQNFTVDKVTQMLSEKSKTVMSISHINIEFFNRVVIDDAYVQDHRGDTMIYIKKLKVGIDAINFINGKISLGTVDVINGECRLYKDSAGVMNVQSVFDHFKPEVAPPDPPDFRMTAREVNLIDFEFSLHDFTAVPQKYGINFQAMELDKIHFQGRNVEIFNYDVLLSIEHLTLQERSGFYLQHLSSPRCGVNESGMRFEKLRLETPQSLLQFAHLYLLYDTWYAYNDFVNKVIVDADISLSKFSYKTLSYFIQQPATIPTTIQMQGRVRGAIPNLHGFFSTIQTHDTELALSFSVIGLPNIKNTQFNILLEELSTNANNIKSIYSELTGNNINSIDPILQRAGNIDVSGTFKGKLTDFQTEASVKTAQGELRGALNVVPYDMDRVQFIGNLNTENFNIGELLAQPLLRGVSLNANVNAMVSRKQHMSLSTNAHISHLHFSGYDFSKISLDGKFLGKTYEGMVSSLDTNLNFTTRGKFDLSGPTPAYKFEMELNRANLFALGLNKRDSISELSAQFSANGFGTNLENINGLTTIEKIIYINHIDTVRAGKINILSQNSDTSKMMKMSSDFADVELRATANYSQILSYITQAAKKYIPSIPDAEAIITREKTRNKQTTESPKFSSGSYALDVDVKQANNVASIFLPGLDIAQGTKLSLLFDPAHDKFRIDMNSDFIGNNKESLRKIKLIGRNAADSVVFRLRAAVCEFGGLYMPNFEILGRIQNNQIGLKAGFENPTDGTRASLITITSIYRTPENLPQIKVELLPTQFAIEHKAWDISPSNIILDSTGISVNHFGISNETEKLTIDGKIGEKQKDVIAVDVHNFDISAASVLTSALGYHLSGQIDGTARGRAITGALSFDALFKIKEMKINDFELGAPTFSSVWNPATQRIHMEVTGDNGNKPINGYYDMKTNRYRADIKFPHMNLVLLEPLLKDIFINTSGDANVDLSLTGGKNTPTLNGTIDIEQYNIQVDYTKAKYTVSGLVNVKDNLFKAPNLALTDSIRGKGVVDAWFNSHHFQDLSFSADIHLTDLLALNTTIQDNNIFYGKAYGTGQFLINGNERETQMTINATTALDSEFYLPFSGISTIEEAKFITYVDPQRNDEPEIEPRSSIRKNTNRVQYTNELDIKINLNVLQNTKAQIMINNDYTGNVIEGYGNGNFLMHINPQQDIFTMNGSYEIDRGGYHFSLWRIFDKRFSIQSGSTVNWTGNPAEPTVNIDAVYKVKASLEPLTGSMGGSASNININCGVNLTGKLFSPDLKLSIAAPSADPETQNILRNALNTEEAITNQFMSLFISRTFIPDMGAASIGSMSGSMAGATAFEFISNQISNLISSNKYDIRLGYRPRTETTSDEFSVDFETDIIANKLSIELGGNYNTGNNPTYNRTPFTGDAYITYILNRAATLRLKGFTRVIERFDETQGLQETGVGVYYRQDFQTVEELVNKWKKSREEIKKRRTERKSTKLF